MNRLDICAREGVAFVEGADLREAVLVTYYYLPIQILQRDQIRASDVRYRIPYGCVESYFMYDV